ncbi:MAG: hypothetical protein DRP03_00140 [Candidatus Aenigmatarchaeota archaeon]|nr:MAG: hypothetical protein DRP03_00140 [Candidatus Aenigmarchaeota archaeon]
MNLKLFSAFIFTLLMIGLVVADTPPPKILLVEDAHFCGGYSPTEKCTNAQIEPFYTKALEANGYEYDTYVVSGSSDNGPDLETLSKYDIVIWFTGEDHKNTLTSVDINNLQQYLDNGGAFFLTGQDIGYDIWDTAFYGEYLHAFYCADSSGEYDHTLVGTNNNPIGDGLFPTIDSTIKGGADNQYFPSVIFYRDGKDIYFRYNMLSSEFYYEYIDAALIICGNGKKYVLRQSVLPAAIKAKTATYKVVYFAFGFEGIDSDADRNEIMKRVIGYLSRPRVKGTRVLEVNGIQYNLTCDKSLDKCSRMLYPYLYYTCYNDQLFGNITDVEFYVYDQNNNLVKQGKPSLQYDANSNKWWGIGVIIINGLADGPYVVKLRCKDSDGFWSKFDEVNLTIDNTFDNKPIIDSVEGKTSTPIYTNKVEPTITTTYLANKELPEKMLFLCYNSTSIIKNTTLEWITYQASYNFNITNTFYNCSSSDGLRRVYLFYMDKAGNVILPKDGDGYKDIILDRVKPEIHSISPTGYIKSGTNIAVNASDGLSGIATAIYNNGTHNFTFTPNISFDPHWQVEGISTLKVWITDNAGNVRYASYNYIVDNTPPTIDVIEPDNNSLTNKQSIEIRFNVTDQAGVDNNSINVVVSNGSIYSSICNQINNGYACTYLWNTTNLTFGNYTIRIYASDSLNNSAYDIINVKIDRIPPIITIIQPPNEYNTTSSNNLLNVSAYDNTDIDYESAYFIFKNLTAEYNESAYKGSWKQLTYSNGYFISTFSVELGLSDGHYKLLVSINDTLGNMNIAWVNISIDNTPPQTTDNSSSVDVWYRSDQYISLSCSDNMMGCNETYYCVASQLCIPSIKGNSTSVTCNDGDECILYVFYKSIDKVGNEENIKSSNKIKIDKRAPTITIENPTQGRVYSGIIELRATISDHGSGVDNAWYEIINASNTSEIIATGALQAPLYNSTWNSSNYTYATLIFKVYANDTLGNNATANVTFDVNNKKPTATIYYPKYIFIGKAFNLDLRAKRENGNLSNASYTIFNASDIVKTNTTTGINKSEFKFSDLVTIDILADGNYTINFTAYDYAIPPNKAFDSAWFYVDKIPPQTIDSSDPQERWKGSDVYINLSCYDNAAGCETLVYCINTSNQDCQPNKSVSIDKNISILISCNEGDECIKWIKYYSNDTVNNTETLKASYAIKIDKKAPITADNSSSEWKNGDQIIQLNCSDTGSGCNVTLYCIDDTGACVPQNIYEGYVNLTCNDICKKYIRYRSNDSVGNLEPIKTSKLIRIDKSLPQTAISPNSSYLPINTPFSLSCSDTGSGCNKTYYKIIDSNGICPSTGYSEGENGIVSCDNGAVCEKRICYYSSDMAGNKENVKVSGIFKIDKAPPVLTALYINVTDDTIFGDKRVLNGSIIKVYVNLSDTSNVSSVNVTVKTPSKLFNLTLSLEDGNYSNGTWSNVLVVNETGIYNLTYIYALDSFNNKLVTYRGYYFHSVVPRLNILLNNKTFADAGKTYILEMKASFNITLINPVLIIYLPPFFENKSVYKCTFSGGCDITKFGDVLHVNASGYGTYLSINTNIFANTIASDTNVSWNTSYNNLQFKNKTIILTPQINITNTWCDGKACTVDQNKVFNLTIEVSNIKSDKHSGTAYNITLNITFHNATSALVPIGDLPSNSSANITIRVNITEAGNKSISMFAFDGTCSYNSSNTTLIIVVRDKEKPTVELVEFEDSYVNVNETINYYVTARDNVGIGSIIAQINDSEGLESNYTLSLFAGSKEYGIWRLSYVYTQKEGIYKIMKIYVNDTAGNTLSYTPPINASVFYVTAFILNMSLSPQILTIGEGVNIYVNISNNASPITNVYATIVKPNNYTKSYELNYDGYENGKYIYSLEYTNTTTSGSYIVNLTVRTKIEKNAKAYFSVPYGFPSLVSSSGNNISVPPNTKFNITWLIKPVNGDLLSVNATIFIENKSVINTSEGYKKFVGNIYWEKYKDNGKMLMWEFNASDAGETNISLVVNTTNSSANISIAINIIKSDTLPPRIHNVSINKNKFNLYQYAIITANASDNTLIKHTSLEISHNNYKVNISSEQIGEGLYRFTFSSINETGSYWYRVWVCDVFDNCNVSSSFNFSAFNTYTVIASIDKTRYNKGRNVTFLLEVLDVNNMSVDNYKTTSIVKIDNPESEVCDGYIDSVKNATFYYFISPSDYPNSDNDACYYVFINVTKNGNTGNASLSFNVSKKLNVEFISPQTGEYVPVDTPVLVEISVNDVNENVLDNVRARAYCFECGDKNTILTYYPPRRTYVNFQAFDAPQTETGDFAIFAYVTDIYDNDQGENPPRVVPTTIESSVPQTQAAQGIGGTSSTQGASGGEATCKCELWKNVGCGANKCKAHEMYQVRVCEPAGCGIEERCIRHKECEPKRDFVLKVSERYIRIGKGYNASIIISIENTGNTALNLTFFVKKECCIVPNPGRITIDPNERVEIPIDIHVPLYERSGQYIIIIGASSGLLNKTIAIDIFAAESPLTKRFNALRNILRDIKNDIKEYKDSGIDVSKLEELVSIAEAYLNRSQESIIRDDVSGLETYLDKISEKLGMAQNELVYLWIYKFLNENKWNLTIIAILIFIFSYIISEIIIPYYKLSKELTALKEKENTLVQSRLETEKQYFTRRIDETTFNKMVIEIQQNILKVRSKIRNKTIEKEGLIRAKLRPSSLLYWSESIILRIVSLLKNIIDKAKAR